MVNSPLSNISNWLTEHNYFEWTELKFELDSNALKITIDHVDVLDKYAGEVCRHLIAELCLIQVVRIYKILRYFDEKEKRIISECLELDLEQQIEVLNGSSMLSIKPLPSSIGVFIDHEEEMVSCVIEAKAIQYRVIQSMVKSVPPLLSKDFFALVYRIKHLPSVDFWIDSECKCWYAGYFGEKIMCSDITDHNLDGLSIVTSNLDTVGVLIYQSDANDGLIKITFEYGGDSLNDLFFQIKIKSLQTVLEKVVCGNVIFDQDQWRFYLESGKMK